MKILITGSSGFIGRNIKEQLSGKYRLFTPSSSELNLLEDEKVYEYLKKHSFDIVLHTATWNATRNSKKDTTMVLENNLRFFFNITRCAEFYDRLIYYGSGAEFDRRHWIPKMDETYFGKYIPADQYGLSKYIMTHYALREKNIYNLRLFGVFGKYEDWEIRFISNACLKVIFNLPITIKKNVVFDYLYIDDLVRITDWFIQNTPLEKVYNICTGVTYDLISLAKMILRISGKNFDIIIKNKEIGREYSGNNAIFLAETKKVTFRKIEESIKELYYWYETNKHLIDKNKVLADK
jgi:UDP-glucose 4-epimerase